MHIFLGFSASVLLLLFGLVLVYPGKKKSKKDYNDFIVII